VDVEEGKEGTQNEGTLGAFVVELSDTDITTQLPVNDPKHAPKLKYIEGCINTVNVGSGRGLTRKLRDEFWATRTDLINRTIKIKFQETSINEDGKHSLRFPIFTELRTDK
jgi:hypothetical protein